MLNITSLLHPVMIAKIRKGITLAAQGKGHEMGGHANRVYIANRKGHNIMRIDWLGNNKFIAYGGADWGRTEITDIVQSALQRGCSSDRVKPRQLSCDHLMTREFSPANHKKRPQMRLYGLLSLLALMFVVMMPNESAYADKPPTALELACTKEPNLLVCEWVIEGLAKYQKEQNNALQAKPSL